MNNRINQKGFTFLEVILVLTIISIVVAAYAPSMIKAKADEYILAKVSQEIKTRQQASKRYYRDYSAWPSSATDLKSPTPNANNPSGTPYLNPSSSETSPYGTNYVFSSTSNTLTISLNLHRDVSGRLAARLPNAVVYQDVEPNQIDRVESTVSTTEGGTTANGYPDTAVRAYLTGDQIIASGTITKVRLDAKTYDTGNNFDTTNYRYTVPSSGKYVIIGEVWFKCYSQSYDRNFAVWKNGSITLTQAVGHDDTSCTKESLVINDVRELTTNDYIEFYVTHWKGSDAQLQGENGLATWIIIYRLF